MIYQETSAFNTVLVMFLIQEGSIWMKYLALREFLFFTNFPAELTEAQSSYIKIYENVEPFNAPSGACPTKTRLSSQTT